LDGPFDFVLLDLWKQHYIPCLERVRPKLSRHAIVIADNMLRPAISRPDAERYRAAVRADPRFQSVLLPIGQGMELSCYYPDARDRTG
jgi:predicted O-methyltransferase YrrM